MQCCAFQAHNRHAGVFQELTDNSFGIILIPIFQAGETADAKDIKILAKHRCGILHVLNRGAIHYRAFFKFQGPSFLVDIKDNSIHAQIIGRYAGT